MKEASQKPITSQNSAATPIAAVPDPLDCAIQLAVGGDLAAFEELYRAYVKNIYRYFNYRIRNSTEAEDLTAQVFLKAWQAIGTFKVTGVPFLAWLYRIAHNELLLYYRAQHQRATNEFQPGFEESGAIGRWPGGTDTLGELIETISDESPESNPHHLVLRKAQKHLLYESINRLPEVYQQVIYFRFIEAWSHAQIAQFLEKNESTVRGIQLRALAMLGKLLDKESVIGD